MVKNWGTFAEWESRIPFVSFFVQRLSQSYARRRYAWQTVEPATPVQTTWTSLILLSTV
jgi:hypothetical protein